MRSFKLILGTVSLIFISCTKEAINQSEPNISGKWQLVHKTGGFSGRDTIISASTIILSLNSNKQFTEEVNGSVSQQGNYDIKVVKSIFTQTAELAIRFQQGEYKLLSLRSDSLFLLDNHTEPYKSSYKRVQ